MESNESAISVIVCCYNSASRLPETINHLIRQKVGSELQWELLIIDNASTDNTKNIAGNILAGAPGKIDYRIINQPEKGLAKARKKGISESKYSILIFCDDDNHFENNYLQTAWDLMKKLPEAGILGGLSKPKLAFYPGKWIEDMYPAMAIGARGQEDGYVEWVYGAGMVLRKKILDQLDASDIKFLLSDRVGSKQTSGGDAELCELVKYLGYKIFYTSKLQFFHEMPEARLRKGFFIRGNYRNVFPSIYLYILNELVSKRQNTDSSDQLYKQYIKRHISLLLYAIPRNFAGRHRFYHFIMLFQSSQIIAWLLFRKKKFGSAYTNIKINLQYDKRAHTL